MDLQWSRNREIEEEGLIKVWGEGEDKEEEQGEGGRTEMEWDGAGGKDNLNFLSVLTGKDKWFIFFTHFWKGKGASATFLKPKDAMINK